MVQPFHEISAADICTHQSQQSHKTFIHTQSLSQSYTRDGEVDSLFPNRVLPPCQCRGMQLLVLVTMAEIFITPLPQRQSSLRIDSPFPQLE
jgi:hypothetical protein